MEDSFERAGDVETGEVGTSVAFSAVSFEDIVRYSFDGV